MHSRAAAAAADPAAPDLRQPELGFIAAAETNGYDTWQAQRRAVLADLTRRLDLPLGRRVELWLKGDIRLLGELRLKEGLLFVEEGEEKKLRLKVDGVEFSVDEIERFLRVD